MWAAGAASICARAAAELAVQHVDTAVVTVGVAAGAKIVVVAAMRGRLRPHLDACLCGS